MIKICYIEDEIDLASLVIKYLKMEEYQVIHYTNGDTIFKGNADFDLFILDIMLEGEHNGYDILKKVKSLNPQAFVIFTSCRNQDLDKIIGLEMGGDDYLAKPFSPKELLLRVKNILKRKNFTEDISINGYKIDMAQRRIYYNSETLDLTSKEFDLISFFINNPKKAFSREDILKFVWGENYFGSDRVVDDLMRRMRKKIIHLDFETIYGFGYRLNI